MILEILNSAHTNTTQQHRTLGMTLKFLAARGTNTRALSEDELDRRWQSRPSAYKRTTADYQQVQFRFLPLAGFHTLLRFDIFMCMVEMGQWKWSTAETYWGAVLATLSACQIPIEAHDRKNMVWLKAKAQAEVPHTAPPLTVIHIMSLPGDEVSLLIIVSWLLGQRISDFSLVRTQRTVPLWQNRVMAFTLVEGKVISRIGPYTLFLDLGNTVGHAMFSHWRRRQHKNHLWSSTALAAASVRLHEMNLENRSVRRGGLQRMAQLGWPVEIILMHSKHRDRPMLMRYLGHGQTVLDDAKKMLLVQASML